MQRRFLFSALFSASLCGLGAPLALAAEPTPLRVLSHGSFSLPKATLAAFEKEAGVKLEVLKAGDAGEMLNKLILTRANPIADVVFGVDNTLAARANFTGRAITVEFAQETLRDLLRAQQQAISIANIQKTVADYYGLQVKDLLSKRRTRSLARPRQVAMALAKELTEHSLPEIGDAFAGRDHTTVLHACRQIKNLMETDGKLREDWDKLIRKLSE